MVCPSLVAYLCVVAVIDPFADQWQDGKQRTIDLTRKQLYSLAMRLICKNAPNIDPPDTEGIALIRISLFQGVIFGRETQPINSKLYK